MSAGAPPSAWLARLAGWYRALDGGRRASVAALVAANAVPIVGVLFLGWSLMTILVVYWLENGIVGLWNLPRIALARGDGLGGVAARTPVALGCGRLFLIPFFAVHYGAFWLGHGFFLAFLPLFAAGGLGPIETTVEPTFPPGLDPAGVPGFGAVDPVALGLAGFALVVSHGVSFFANYLGRREFSTATPESRMGAVYGRVVVLHLTIIFGSIAVAALGSPIWILVVLVAAKTVLDLGLHVREHRRAAPG